MIQEEEEEAVVLQNYLIWVNDTVADVWKYIFLMILGNYF